MATKRPPLNETLSLYQGIIAREGTTTAPSLVGNSIIDAGLIGFGAGSFRSMTLQIYPGDETRVDTGDITGFDNVAGEVFVSSAMKGGPVPAGVPYKILTLRPAIAEVHGVFTVLPSAPETVEPDTVQDLSLSISTVEGIPVVANLTAGTITITRVRAGVEAVIVNAAACATANGRIFYAYTFPSAGAAWQAGDEYKAVFTGQQVAVGATTYSLSDIRCKGRVSREAAAGGAIAAIEAKLDLPAVDEPLNLRIAEVVGNKADTATPDNMAALATSSLVRDIKRALLRLSPDAFGATVNGNADTALDDMVAHLAAYFVSAGAAWSVTVNPGGGPKTDLVTTLSSIADMLAGATGIATYPAAVDIGNGVSMAEALRAILTSLVAGDDYDAYTAINNIARASVNACFQGIASVLGADAANVFNPIVNNAAQVTLEAALSALNDILVSAAGIAAWAARALPANGVSLSEVERYIAEVKPEWAARISATHTTTTATEETILTTAYTVPGLFYFNLTLRNMVVGDDFTIRVYKRVDGANYDLKSEQQFVNAPTIKVYEIEGLYTDATEFIRVTVLRNSATDRAFPYSYNCIRQPVA